MMFRTKLGVYSTYTRIFTTLYVYTHSLTLPHFQVRYHYCSTATAFAPPDCGGNLSVLVVGCCSFSFIHWMSFYKVICFDMISFNFMDICICIYEMSDFEVGY